VGAEFFRIFDSVNIHGIRALRRSTQRCGSGGCRFFWSLDEITRMIFSIFRLGRIASGYFDNLGKAHPVNCQISTGNSLKTNNSSKNQSVHTSVRGFDLLKASVPKIFGTIDFFLKEVTA
jgi:hypothetical protein